MPTGNISPASPKQNSLSSPLLFSSSIAKKLSYQLFIEPKGDGYIAKDQWKEDFLHEINIKAKIKKVEMLYEDDKFKIFGLSFYN